MSSPSEPHVVVVGGGIAGLAAAHHLLKIRPSLRVTVLEGSPQAGGKLRLDEVAGIAVDVGAESILNRRPEGVDLARRVGLADSVVHPAMAAGVWTRGRVIPLPPTIMGVPVEMGTVARSGFLSRRGVLRARAERLLPRLDLDADQPVGGLVARRLGPEVRDRLVEPLLGGVYAGHADELSVHATIPQLVAAVREHGRLLAAAAALASGNFPVPPPAARDATEAADADAAPPPPATRPGEPPPVFAGIEGGVGRLAAQVANDVTRLGGAVRTNATVRELGRTPERWHLVVGPTRTPETVEADGVILATPASPGARLLREVAPAASRELSRIEYASVAIVTLAVRATDLPSKVTGSGFLVPPVDGHVIKAATFSSAKWAWLAGDTFLLRASIGRHHEAAALQRDDAYLVDAAMADLREAVGLRGPLVDAVVTRWGGALPQYAVGHLDRVAAIRAAVADVPSLAVCGAAYDGVGIPAVVASAHAAATQVLDHLSAAATMEL